MTIRSDPPTPGAVPPADRPQRTTRTKRVMARLRNYFFTGVIITAPIGITAYLTWLVVTGIDAHITPLVPARYNPQSYLPFAVPGFGVFVVLLFLTLVGAFTANFFGRALISAGERLVDRMPVVRSIYGTLKQIFETVMQQSATTFNKAVLVEYPRRGIWALAFVTADTRGEIRRSLDDELVSVFLPTTPNPTSGFLLFVPRRDVVFLDMTVEEAAKMVISAGVVSPSDRAPVPYLASDDAADADADVRVPEPVSRT